jgi:hypothetical protein
MDPFIEACGLWGDFHDKLIGEIEREVSRQLPSRYVARMGERTYVEWIDPRNLESMPRPFEPDLSIRGGRCGRKRQRCCRRSSDSAKRLSIFASVHPRSLVVPVPFFIRPTEVCPSNFWFIRLKRAPEPCGGGEKWSVVGQRFAVAPELLCLESV